MSADTKSTATPETKDLLTRAVEQGIARAKQAGAAEVAATASRSRESGVTWRDGKLEKTESATTLGLTLQLYVDGRYSAMSTSDLRPEAIDRFIADSVAMTRALTPDPHRGLPDISLSRYEQVELDVDDSAGFAKVTPDSRVALVKAIEAAARSVKGSDKFNSVTADAGDTQTELVRAHSNGFLGTRKDTVFYAGASASITDSDGRRPSDGSSFVTRRLGDLPSAELLGEEASLRTLSRLGTVKPASAKLPALVENRAAGRILSHLMAPMSASALQQKRSCFDGKLGKAIGSAKLSFRDAPHLRGALGSRLFDSEGMASRPMAIFENGVLETYFVDNYYGRKLSMAPTTARPSNLEWKLGDKDLDGLMREMGEGILITGFLGGNSNATSGDFSVGVEGFRIRKGKRAEPVGEMNLSGNHLAFWKSLAAVGNDPWLSSSFRSPTLAFEPLQFAGA